MQKNQQTYSKKKFSINDLLGSRTYGKVYRIEEKRTHQIYACKISKIEIITNDNSDSLTNLSQEVNILARLNHPSILKFILYNPFNFKKPKPIIIAEYAINGSLADLIENDRQSPNNQILTDTRKLILLYGISTAMAYLHSHNILHRDLKPENILISQFLKKETR